VALVFSQRDRALIEGELGPAGAMSMRILVRMARIQGATRFLDITGAHIDSALYMGDATLEYAERLADLGAAVVVPTTLNVAGVDPHGWERWAVPPEWAAKARRQMDAYQRMGCAPTWTCAPYQTERRPGFGEQVAWGESSAIVFANSVLGARTERYPDLLDICAAVTGRVPAVGLHLDENRAGQIRVVLRDVPLEVQAHESFYPVFGHWVGSRVGSRVPVISGLAVAPDEDELKAMGAAMASSGAVALFHLVGVTPEASTEAEAFHGRSPEEEIVADLDSLRAARRDLHTAQGESLDMVVLGSPHFSLAEFRRLIPMLEGRQAHETVRFLVTCGRGVKLLAREAGLLEPLERFGGEVTVDTCILTTPMLGEDIRVIMTNSAKYAYYAPGLLGTTVAFGSLEDCVASAEAGRVIRREGPWGG
jgi:predicted aconitase